MKGAFRSEAGAVMLWLFATLLLAASIVPWLYRAGNALAAAAATQELPVMVEWLGAACGRADLARYFNRSLLLAALLLLPWVHWRIHKIRACKLPAVVGRVGWQAGWLQIVVGFGITAGVSWAMCLVFEAFGAYAWRPRPLEWGQVVSRVLFPVVGVALLEEWLFRGILLGMWLRFAGPWMSCIGTSLTFAMTHFLVMPKGVAVSDPASYWAGYELLGKMWLHFTDPMFLVTSFLTLFAIGMVLAWAQIRTAGLWLSIGLHAGWIAAVKSFNLLYHSVEGHPLYPWALGDSLRCGLFPLMSVLMIALVCHGAFKVFTRIASR